MTIDLKRGIEKNSDYVILHIRDKTPFSCSTRISKTGEPERYECCFQNLPESRLVPVKSDFFNLLFFEKGKRNCPFEVHIVPKKRSLIYPLPPPIYIKPVVEASKPKYSRHWAAVGYEKTPPYLGKKRHFVDRLSFPLDFSDYAIPSVGAVDINGQPVFMKDNKDVERFIAVKQAFESHKYAKAYDLASEALRQYPNSIFASDFLRYKIKALAKMDMKEHADEIIKLGRIFIKRYTSDEYLPEVLLIMARVYSATGFVSDASYFFDRLINEHKGSRYANLGLIYLGDQLYINGKAKEAIKRYLEAYYRAKEIDVASLAAYKLAIRYMDRGKIKEATKYLRKIWEKNPKFILKNIEDAHHIAKQLASHGIYNLAIDINKELLKHLRKIDSMYEDVLFEIAEWYDDQKHVKDAIDWYERYLDEFPFGSHSDKAKENLDALFAVSQDMNATEALKKYERLIHEYVGSDIADKALVAKLKILLAQKRYNEILAAKGAVEAMKSPDAKESALDAIKEAAAALLRRYMQNGDCKNGIALVEDFDIKPPPKDDTFLFKCYLEYAQYDKAHNIATKHLLDNDMKSRTEWLCRDLHVLTLMKNYREASKAAQDLRTLLKDKAEKKCPTLLWDEVKAYDALGMYAKEMVLIHKMADLFKRDIRMAEVLRMGYNAAKKHGDAMQQLWLLQKLISLQNRLGAHPYSPWAEFEAIRVLKERKEYDRALKIALSMKKLPLKGEQKARWLYEQGVLFNLLNKKDASKKSFKECSKVKNSGAWGKLCVQALSVP
ncbi:tetratricopeptide repeat protein [Hydrogenimonas sp.]